MIYLCYVNEETRWDNMYAWADKWAHNFSFFPIIVDYIGNRPKNSIPAPIVVDTFDEARSLPQLVDMTWVYLTLDGSTMLPDFQHPVDDAVYAIGSDFNGFGDHVIDGVTIQLPPTQMYAGLTIPMPAYDRYLSSEGKKK